MSDMPKAEQKPCFLYQAHFPLLFHCLEFENLLNSMQKKLYQSGKLEEGLRNSRMELTAKKFLNGQKMRESRTTDDCHFQIIQGLQEKSYVSALHFARS